VFFKRQGVSHPDLDEAQAVAQLSSTSFETEEDVGQGDARVNHLRGWSRNVTVVQDEGRHRQNLSCMFGSKHMSETGSCFRNRVMFLSFTGAVNRNKQQQKTNSASPVLSTETNNNKKNKLSFTGAVNRDKKNK
jgi:hypothetical protein